MKQQKRNSPAELSRTTGLSKGNTNTKPVFTSIVGTQTPQSQYSVNVFWHHSPEISPELKRVFAMLLRGRDNGV